MKHKNAQIDFNQFNLINPIVEWYESIQAVRGAYGQNGDLNCTNIHSRKVDHSVENKIMINKMRRDLRMGKNQIGCKSEVKS